LVARPNLFWSIDEFDTQVFTIWRNAEMRSIAVIIEIDGASPATGLSWQEGHKDLSVGMLTHRNPPE
jgi:hypothetical protein